MPKQFSLEARLDYLQKHGKHVMAWSTLQPNMEYFDLAGIGYIAYRTQKQSVFALGDPICAETAYKTLLSGFLSEHPHANFLQLSDPVARLLRQDFHYYTVQMGIEIRMNADTWSLAGKSKSHVRRWINTAQNARVTVRELERSKNSSAVSLIQRDWLSRHSRRSKLGFLVRDFYSHPLLNAMTRLFGAYQADRLVGFVEFDPLFEQKRITGYYADLIQASADAPNGTTDLIITTAMKTFQAEGKPILSLGLAPLAQLMPCAMEPPFLRRCLSMMYHCGNFLYNFKGVYFHKDKYRGQVLPAFYATTRRNSFLEVLNLFHLVGII
jgi:lysylphosphatidylglycerol synthetase-like protein (DUF2156 family)